MSNVYFWTPGMNVLLFFCHNLILYYFQLWCTACLPYFYSSWSRPCPKTTDTLHIDYMTLVTGAGVTVWPQCGASLVSWCCWWSGRVSSSVCTPVSTWPVSRTSWRYNLLTSNTGNVFELLSLFYD